jgi:TPR repeat protein
MDSPGGRDDPGREDLDGVAAFRIAENHVARGDLEQAEVWYQKGAEAGDLESMSIVGVLHKRLGNEESNVRTRSPAYRTGATSSQRSSGSRG